MGGRCKVTQQPEVAYDFWHTQKRSMLHVCVCHKPMADVYICAQWEPLCKFAEKLKEVLRCQVVV